MIVPMAESTLWTPTQPKSWATASQEIALWRLDLTEGASDLLSADELARAERIPDPHRRRIFCRARSALRRILGGYLGIPPGNVVFRYGPSGKPHLHRPGTGIEFNLSHSGELALVAVSNVGPVGIDLEPLRGLETRSLPAIARRVLGEEAACELERLPEGEARCALFARLWTSHEARAKRLGLSLFDDRVRTLEQDPAAVRLVTPREGWIAALATAAQLQDSFSLFAYHLLPDS